jgi:hypothetical protein
MVDYFVAVAVVARVGRVRVLDFDQPAAAAVLNNQTLIHRLNLRPLMPREFNTSLPPDQFAGRAGTICFVTFRHKQALFATPEAGHIVAGRFALADEACGAAV